MDASLTLRRQKQYACTARAANVGLPNEFCCACLCLNYGRVSTALKKVSAIDCSNVGECAAPPVNVLTQEPRLTTVAKNKTNNRDKINNKLVSVSNKRNDRNDHVVNDGPKMPSANKNIHSVQKDEPQGQLGVSTHVNVVLPSRDQGLARAVPPLSPPLGGARE